MSWEHCTRDAYANAVACTVQLPVELGTSPREGICSGLINSAIAACSWCLD